MILRKVRKVPVGTSPTQITEIGANRVAFHRVIYATGGGTIEYSNDGSFSAGSGMPIIAGTHLKIYDQSGSLFARSSAGTIDLFIEDYEV